MSFRWLGPFGRWTTGVALGGKGRESPPGRGGALMRGTQPHRPTRDPAAPGPEGPCGRSPPGGRRVWYRAGGIQARTRTWTALGRPLSSWPISNSTSSPSRRTRPPSTSLAWTKASLALVFPQDEPIPFGHVEPLHLAPHGLLLPCSAPLPSPRMPRFGARRQSPARRIHEGARDFSGLNRIAAPKGFS